MWTFTSAASDAQLSENFTLCGYMPNYETDRTCQIQPLLQLRYMLDLNTWNRAPAGQRHAVAIEASYLPEAVHVEGNGSIRPKDLTMTVQATFDDGATWQPVDLKQQGRNFRALIDHPALDATSGFVGLRVTATDTTTGATIKQVHHRAYMLE